MTTFASIFRGCHRELIQYQPQVSVELLNLVELIGKMFGVRAKSSAAA